MVETRLRAGKITIVAITPVTEVNGSLRQAAAIGVDQVVKVRGEQRIYPQQYVASRPRDSDMKLQAVQRFRVPPTGDTLCR